MHLLKVLFFGEYGYTEDEIKFVLGTKTSTDNYELLYDYPRYYNGHEVLSAVDIQHHVEEL